jgi:GDP-4-dehydro-6-deoxy-D-mannose reductase
MLDRGYAVFGGTIDQATGPAVLTASQRAAVQWLPMDTGSDDAVARALDASSPDYVVHLAAMAFPQDAAAAPTKAFDVNAFGVFRLLHRLAAVGARGTRVLVVGSAEQYGSHEAGEYPLLESAAQVPATVYAASKAAQELMALQMARAEGMQVVCTRSFNHSGFGHGPQYLLPALVERGQGLRTSGGAMRLGNTTPVRDYLHVADVTAAYEALLDRGQAGEVYNVSSGKGNSVREIAERVLKRLGITAEISSDPALVRAHDWPMNVGNSAKLRAATGWVPQHTLDDIIDDLIHAKAR